jgi:electron transport complex protein RnfC
MMGLAQYTDDFAVMKTMSGVLVERAGWDGAFEPCIRCGRCVEACPMGLVPSRLSTLAEAGRFTDMRGWSMIDCIECGCCAYVCPARRPIVQHVKLGKWMLQQEAAKERALAAAEKENQEKESQETEKAGKGEEKGGVS